MPRAALLRLVEQQEGVSRSKFPFPALFRSLASLLEAQQLCLVSGLPESYKTWKQGSTQ